jgi:hypothetical protein
MSKSDIIEAAYNTIDTNYEEESERLHSIIREANVTHARDIASLVEQINWATKYVEENGGGIISIGRGSFDHFSYDNIAYWDRDDSDDSKPTFDESPPYLIGVADRTPEEVTNYWENSWRHDPEALNLPIIAFANGKKLFLYYGVEDHNETGSLLYDLSPTQEYATFKPLKRG